MTEAEIKQAVKEHETLLRSMSTISKQLNVLIIITHKPHHPPIEEFEKQFGIKITP